MILRHQPDNLSTLTDHDLRIEGKPGYQFGAELPSGDRLADHEGARCADVDGVKVPQLSGERGRSEGPVTTDVNPSQKDYDCHQGSRLAMLTAANTSIHILSKPNDTR